MSKRNLSYFAADVHLGLDVKNKDARETRFVSFLRFIPKDSTDTLYLLGDIWDFWYEYDDVVPKGYVRVFAALTDLIDAGVKVKFFPGNHDIWCYSYFAELGIEIVNQPMVTEIGGKRFFLAHGDGLGKGMYSYKLLKWIFHWKLCQTLFSSLHPKIAFRLGRRWSMNSRLAKSEEYYFRGADEPLYQYSAQMAVDDSIDCFIYGHYHNSVDLTLPSGARMVILKDWMDSSPYAVFDGEILRIY